MSSQGPDEKGAGSQSSRRCDEESRSERSEDAVLLVLKTEEGAVRQGMVSRSWKMQSKDSLSLSLQKEPAPSAWGRLEPHFRHATSQPSGNNTDMALGHCICGASLQRPQESNARSPRAGRPSWPSRLQHPRTVPNMKRALSKRLLSE